MSLDSVHEAEGDRGGCNLVWNYISLDQFSTLSLNLDAVGVCELSSAALQRQTAATSSTMERPGSAETTPNARRRHRTVMGRSDSDSTRKTGLDRSFTVGRPDRGGGEGCGQTLPHIPLTL